MGAREKLNAAYLNGCLIIAAVVGLASGSWVVFGAVLAVLVGGALYSGEIRPRRRR